MDLGPGERHPGDRIVRAAALEAEEIGITSQNIDQQMTSTNPAVQRFVGATGDFGRMLGVDNRWAYNIIKQVGNYGESYERTVGMGSPLKLKRGANELWTKGGLLYSPPFQ